MRQLRPTYTVKGVSHHDVADRLGVWLPECVGRMVTLVVESAEENEIGVECVAVYDVDEHLGYIDDNQKQELLTVLHAGRRHTLRSHIVSYNEGKGAEEKYSQAKLTIEAPRLRNDDDGDNEYFPAPQRSPWEDWTYDGPLVPRTAIVRKLDTVRSVLMEMIEDNEPWSEYVRRNVLAFCRNGFIDLSGEMRQDMLRVMHWLECGDTPEMRGMADCVMDVMTNMGSEENRVLHVRQLITEKVQSSGCKAIIDEDGFDINYLRGHYEAMPYRTEWHISDEASEKRFVAKLYYDNTLTREKLEQIYSVIALCKRYEIEEAKHRKVAADKPRVVSLDALAGVASRVDDRTLANQFDHLIRKALNEDITREDIRILNTIDAAYDGEKQEAKEDVKKTAEAMEKLASKPTSIGQLNMGNGEQTLPPSTDIPLITEQK
ncbi:MAG: hypothetical protein Q4D33_12230 [Prevotellaceae bacterium]|nr:hypothetical protein [Prevotellaceae bacterium]